MSKQLARDVLTMAQSGNMPDSYWLTDRRIARACAVLGIEVSFAQQFAEDTCDFQWAVDEEEQES